ncbi:MAG: TRAP transporter large permease [Bacteroidota bacterium]
MISSGIAVLIIAFIVLMVMGVPIAYSIGIATILTMFVSIDFFPAISTISHRMSSGLNSFTLLAIPFFVLAGNIMNKGGIALRLVELARVMAGKSTGGLAFVNIFANMLFGAISGSAAASASAIGSIMGPEMEKEGYNKDFSAALNITSATTGLSIPPSNVLIVYSLASGGISISALFLAGYLPGILTGLALMLVAWVLLKINRDGHNKGLLALAKLLLVLIPVGAGAFYFLTSSLNSSFKTGALIFVLLAVVSYLTFVNRSNVKNLVIKFWRALPSLILLVIVIGGIISGIFTATEASAVAVVYALGLSLIYKELKIKDLPEVILTSVKTTSIVLFLVSTSMALAWIMAYENIPQIVSSFLLSLSDNPLVLLLIINVILLAMGTFMDITPAILIFTPILLPIAETQLGIDPIHFGIILIMNLSIGLCSPPVGSILFIGCSVAGTSVTKVFKPLLPLYIAMIVVLLLISYVPSISLWLPSLFQ